MEFNVRHVLYDSGFEKKLRKYIKFLGTRERKKLQISVEVFKNNVFDPRLDAHKLTGRMKDRWSFSINYSDRIVFRFVDHESVLFMDVGDHDIYK